MSDTPRCNSMEWSWTQLVHEARQIERELNAANDRIKRLEEALECVVVSCSCLHHPKKYQHKLNEACPVERLIRKAKEAKL